MGPTPYLCDPLSPEELVIAAVGIGMDIAAAVADLAIEERLLHGIQLEHSFLVPGDGDAGIFVLGMITGAGFAHNFSLAGRADAVVNGSVTTARGNVSVEAKTEAEKNVTKAQSLVGSGWFEKATDYLSNASPKKFGIELFKAFSTWGYDKLKDKFDKPPENIEDIKTRPRSNT